MTAIKQSNTGWRLHAAIGMLWLMGASVAAAADAPPLFLEHLTAEDGLPQATVMTTLQDSQGFVWLGTENGLVRYDGRELYRYAHSRTESGSLPDNYVWQVVEDRHGNLWIAMNGGGVAKWDRRTDDFTNYRHVEGDSGSLASDRARTVLIDRRGFVWIGTFDAGVDVLDPSTGEIEHMRHDPDDPASLASDLVFTLALDSAGDVWIGTDRGLNRWRAETHTLARISELPGDAHALNDKSISRVLEGPDGMLWVATFNAGLLRIDRNGSVLETFRHDAGKPGSLPSDDVRALLSDRSGRLWVGTADGLALFDHSTDTFTRYRHDPNDSASLRDSFVMSLYQDPAGLIWIGTRSGGVSRWTPRSWEFGGYRPAWLENQPVFAFEDAPDNQVWIASLSGLVRFDPASRTATPLDTLVGRDNALGDERTTALRRDQSGALWIGTMGSGLKVLLPDGRIESIPVQVGDSRSLSAPGIMAILEARNGAIWIGTYGGGVNVLDPATRTVRQLPYGSAPGAVSSPVVTAIVEDTRGNLWLGTEGDGLNLVHADGTLLQSFRSDPANPSTLPDNAVYALAVDGNGDVWVATGGGLARVAGSAAAPEEIEFQVFSSEDGLSSDTLWGVVPDDSGHLWLSSNTGLMRLDPDTGAVKTYHREHGLQGEEFSFGAHFRLRDGRLGFGGPGGFNIFNPEALSDNRQPPRVALTNVEVLGVKAAGDTPFWLRDPIELDYRGNIVSLDFGVLDFTSPEHNRLAYRMAGLTDDWIDLGTERRITLTNLDPGNHVLEVRAANSDSVWSEEPLRLTIHRDPAPWASPAAYAIYVLALLGFLAERIHRHRQKFREVVRAREHLEAEVQLRTRELRESNQQLAEAAEAKSKFLDRMSHELRTPMNGVVGMTELLSRTTLSPTQSHLTKTIRSSAQILLQIVNDLLDLSKIRAGKVAIEALPIDLCQVLEECTSLFAGAAEAKGIELVVCPPRATECGLLGDPLRIRQVLMNLISNAVKFTEQGEVVVKADLEAVAADQAIVHVAVTDTGIGMDPVAVGKIFEPFAQGDESTTRRFGGTGLGLAICRELADVMGGRLAVTSEPQIGSTFCLSLPLAVEVVTESQPAARFAGKRVRILSRRPSLAESLARYATSLGLTVVPDTSGVDDADAVMVDAGSHPGTIDSLLSSAGTARAGLVVIATAAEVDARQLHGQLPDKLIVLKPVHRIALQEALAAAFGMPAAAATSERTDDHAPFTGHVLLVEDEPVNAAVAEGYLAALGCTSVWVKSGAAAVARTAAEHFDMIMMDLNMPGMDGFATAALVRKQQAGTDGGSRKTRIPIVALTAHDAAHYREKCLAADMDDILSKPYTLDDCGSLLRRWLQRADAATSTAGTAAAGNDAPSSLASIDASAVSALHRLRAGSRTDLYPKLVDLFRSSSAQSLTELSSALERDDLAAAAAVCHKMAAAAGNVGALEYARRIRTLEQHCLAGEREHATRLCRELQAAHAPLLETLHEQRLRAIA